MQPDHYGVMWWDGHEDCRINGETARRNAFLNTIAALKGVDPEDELLDQTELELTPVAATRFRAGVRDFVTNSARSLPQGETASIGADQGEVIYELLIDAHLQSPSYRGAVKRVALGVGLTEFGRFSVEYRQLFGESPTTTLRRKLPETSP